MISVCALLLLAEPTFVADRYALGERLKLLDAAWMATPDKSKRAAAVIEINASVMSFFGANYGSACRTMDRAIAVLRSEDTDGMALTVRVLPTVVEPGGKVELSANWAYDGGRPIELRVGDAETELKPGYSGKFEFTAPNREGFHLVEAHANGKRIAAEFSVVSRFNERIAKLESSGNRFAKDLATGMLEATGGETTVDLWKSMRVGEKLLNRKGGETVSEVRFAKQGSTFIRAAMPDKPNEPLTVVLALHGAGGSENLFFEGYGRGLAVKEALRRRWVFIAPRASASAASDSVAWLAEFLGKKPERILVMGHSMGGRMALGTGSIKPSAIALFAPASGQVPEVLAQTPIFVAVGKQEISMLRTTALSLKPKVAQFNEYDPCEHLMVVADAVEDAYRFFDAQLR